VAHVTGVVLGMGAWLRRRLAGAPRPLRRGTFEWYIPEITDQAAVILFERRYGRRPEKVLRRDGVLYAGPLTEEEAGDGG